MYSFAGDKKAIEKTSQALREGQPKLRQKIVEMGGQAAMESQYGHPGLYPEQVGLNTAPGMDPGLMMPPSPTHHANHLMQQHRNVAVAAAQSAAMRQQDLLAMQPPAPDSARQEMHAELFQRLSLRDLGTAQEQAEARYQMQQRARMRPSLTRRPGVAQDLGIMESQLSLMSDFSAVSSAVPNESLLSVESSFRRQIAQMTGSQFSMADAYSMGSGGGSMFTNAVNAAMDEPQHHQLSSYSHMSPQAQANVRDKVAGMDRRRVFAKMKYNRPPAPLPPSQKLGTSNHTASQRSLGDGMPDIHMVESTLSMYSNVSTMTDGNTANIAASTASKPPEIPLKGGIYSGVETVKVVDHSRDIHWGGLGGGSRHSIMSGLSRIDDGSIDHSMFSDLSKKIGNVSTRSIAMSEISAIDMQERENEDDTSSDDGFAHAFDGFAPQPLDQRKTQPAMEFDL